MPDPRDFRLDDALQLEPGSVWTAFAAARSRFFADLERQSALHNAERAWEAPAGTEPRWTWATEGDLGAAWGDD